VAEKASLLSDLRALAEEEKSLEEFNRRLISIRTLHEKKGSFVERLDQLGLVATTGRLLSSDPMGTPWPVRYGAAGGPNQVVSASGRPTWVRSPTQATYPSGRINTAVGAVTKPSAGSSHAPTYSASIN